MDWALFIVTEGIQVKASLSSKVMLDLSIVSGVCDIHNSQRCVIPIFM